MIEDKKTKKIYVDGSGDGYICIIFEESNEPILEKHPTNTHNESEWQALFSAISYIKSYEKYTILSDSQLIVRQFNGEYETKDPRMRQWKQRCKQYINTHGLNVEIWWIPRDENLAGKYLEKHIQQ